MMDEFGRSHAGHAVETAQFRAHAEKAAGSSKPLKEFFIRWLDGTGLPDAPEGGTWALDSFEEEPEKALIVYGTLKDVQANAEAAQKLRRGIAARWSNVLVPVKSDTEVSEADWKSLHILLVGRPSANSAADRALKTLPITFGPASFTLQGDDLRPPWLGRRGLGGQPGQPPVRGRPVRRPRGRVDLALCRLSRRSARRGGRPRRRVDAPSIRHSKIGNRRGVNCRDLPSFPQAA